MADLVFALPVSVEQIAAVIKQMNQGVSHKSWPNSTTVCGYHSVFPKSCNTVLKGLLSRTGKM